MRVHACVCVCACGNLSLKLRTLQTRPLEEGIFYLVRQD